MHPPLHHKIRRIFESWTLHLRRFALRHANEKKFREWFLLGFVLIGVGLLLLIFTVTSFLSDNIFKANLGVIAILDVIYLILLRSYLNGHVRRVSCSIVGIFFLGNIYGMLVFGASLPMGLLGMSFTIAVSGMLLGSRKSLIIALITSVSLTIFGLFEAHRGVIAAWKIDPLRYSNVIEYAVMLFLVALITYLSTREFERSLSQAKVFEKALKEERAVLQKLLQRERNLTKDDNIHTTPFEKYAQGIFHDLLKPLSVLLPHVENHAAAHELKDFMKALQTHLTRRKEFRNIDVTEEIRLALGLLSYEIQKKMLRIEKRIDPNSGLIGDVTAFHHIVFNMIANAVEHTPNLSPEAIRISYAELDSKGILIVTNSWNAESMQEQPKKVGLGIGQDLIRKSISEFSGEYHFELMKDRAIATAIFSLFNAPIEIPEHLKEYIKNN